MYKNFARIIRTCRTICVLNTENTLNVELQFELFDFCTSVFVFCKQVAVLYVLFEWHFDDRIIITPHAAYGCESWPSKLTDEQKLKVFENGAIRKIFWSNMEEVTGTFIK